MEGHTGVQESASRGWTQLLLDPGPGDRRWGWAETAALLLWLGLAGFAVAQHTPWTDEVQAWLLAGEVSWKTLFTHSLHYEGTGGLWHATLKLAHAAGLQFTAVRWLLVAVQGAAMAVLLRYAPFPLLPRLLLPFTFFLLYQDTVVARSYGLFAIYAFVAAAMLRSTRQRPVPLALVLGLMANISLHGLVASAGLACVAALVWRGRWLKNVVALLLLLLLWAATLLTMTPAKDIDFAAGNNIQRSFAAAEKKLGLHVAPPAPLAGQTMAGLPQTPLTIHLRHGYDSLWNRLARTLSLVTFPLSGFRFLALSLAAAVAAQAWMVRRAPHFPAAPAGVRVSRDAGALGTTGLVPSLLLIVVFTSVYLAPRHVGVLLTSFVVTAWLTWPGKAALQGKANLRLLQRLATVLLCLVCLEQIGWSLHAIGRERLSPYGAGRMTADYLKSRGVGAPGTEKKLAGFYYYSADPLLYFDRNIYMNQPAHRYWYWSTTMRNYMTVQQVLAQRPDFIIVGGLEAGPDAEIMHDWLTIPVVSPKIPRGDIFLVKEYFEARGYGETHLFCGHIWMRATYAEEICDTVLEPTQAVSSPALPSSSSSN